MRETSIILSTIKLKKKKLGERRQNYGPSRAGSRAFQAEERQGTRPEGRNGMVNQREREKVLPPSGFFSSVIL